MQSLLNFTEMKVKLELTIPDKYIRTDLEMFAAMVEASIGDSTHLKKDVIKCIVKNCVKVVPEVSEREEMLIRLETFAINEANELPNILDKLLAYKGDKDIPAVNAVQDLYLWQSVENWSYETLMAAIQ